MLVEMPGQDHAPVPHKSLFSLIFSEQFWPWLTNRSCAGIAPGAPSAPVSWVYKLRPTLPLVFNPFSRAESTKFVNRPGSTGILFAK